MLWEQFIRPNLKNMRTLVIKPHKGYENTAPLSYPDTWVRKPDCLHLPYTLINSLLDNCTAEGEGRAQIHRPRAPTPGPLTLLSDPQVKNTAAAL